MAGSVAAEEQSQQTSSRRTMLVVTPSHQYVQHTMLYSIKTTKDSQVYINIKLDLSCHPFKNIEMCTVEPL